MRNKASKETIEMRIAHVKANPSKTTAELARELGVSYDIVRMLRRKLGMPARPIRRFTMKERNEIFNLIGRWYYKEIAQKYGCSKQAIYRIGREMRDEQKMAKP